MQIHEHLVPLCISPKYFVRVLSQQSLNRVTQYVKIIEFE